MTLGILWSALASFGLLLVVFTPLERLFPARRQPAFSRPEWRTDAAFFFGQYLVWSGLAVSLLAAVETGIRTLRLDIPGSSSWTSGAPAWLTCVGAVVAGDLLVYAFHRACHRVPLLWRFHAVHHSSRKLDWLAAHREHPVDGILTQLCQNLPAFLLGIDFALLSALVVFRGAWAIFIHSNTRLPLGPLRFVLGAPELHHWHHARTEETRHNFANLAPWIDALFGTYYCPPRDMGYALGLNEPWPSGYWRQLLAPFRPSRPAPRGSTLPPLV